MNSKYEEFHSEIEDSEIENELKNNPALVDEWIFFTEDKRCTPAWGISKVEESYHLFHVQENGRIDRKEVFASPFKACASMVRLEMEDFRQRQNT